jgi:hypothetical protein
VQFDRKYGFCQWKEASLARVGIANVKFSKSGSEFLPNASEYAKITAELDLKLLEAPLSGAISQKRSCRNVCWDARRQVIIGGAIFQMTANQRE